MGEDLNFNYKEQKITVIEKMEPKVKCKIKWIQKILVKLFGYNFVYKDVPIQNTQLLSVDLAETQDELEKKIKELELHNLELEKIILDNGNFTLDLDKNE